MDYTTLIGDVTTVGSIKYAVNFSRIDSVSILTEAQAFIYSKLRVKQMTAVADIAIALSDISAPYPAGYLDPLHLGIPGIMPRIRNRDIEWFRSHLGWDTSAILPVAPANYFCDFNNVLNFDTKSDAAYTAKMTYYRTPVALSGSVLTNFLTDRYPTLLRRACLMYAAEERKERELQQQLTVQILAMIDDIKAEDDLSKRGMEFDFNWSGTDDD